MCVCVCVWWCVCRAKAVKFLLDIFQLALHSPALFFRPFFFFTEYGELLNVQLITYS